MTRGYLMHAAVLDFHEPEATQVAIAGGKGARLAELSQIDGVPVPAGFCVTTDAFRRVMAQAPSFDDRLSRLTPGAGNAIRTLSEEIRLTLDAIAIPEEVATAITRATADDVAYAVRS